MNHSTRTCLICVLLTTSAFLACRPDVSKNEPVSSKTALAPLVGNREENQMPLDEFWGIIERARKKGATEDEQLKQNLINELRNCSDVKLAQFENRWLQLMADAYRWDLWAVIYQINEGCSDDGFFDFRDQLVAKGRAIYENVIRDPENLVAYAEQESPLALYWWDYEAHFHHAAGIAFRLNCGKKANDYAISIPGADFRWPDDPVGEHFDFEDEQIIKQRFPRLWKYLKSLGD